MKKFRFIAAVFLVFIILSYLNYLQYQQNNLKNLTFKKEVKKIQNSFKNMVIQKQKATMGIAISLANNKELAQEVQKREIDKNRYIKIIKEYKKSTLYKNIWIQILDKNGISLYRSWDSLKGDSLVNIRPEIKKIVSNNDKITTISVGKYDLSMKSMVPIKENGTVIGELEVISHFNSIAKIMQHIGIDSVIVVKAKYTKHLKYPFTNIFIKDKYYVANFNGFERHINYLSTNGVERFFIDGYRIENGHLIVSIPIKNFKNETVAYSIMFEKLNIISAIETEFFAFKWVSTFIVLLLLIAIIFAVELFLRNKKQKAYYKNILDSTTNIVMVNNECAMLDVNEVFFKYFNKYSNLEKFKLDHPCICDFFVKEDGYLQVMMDGVSWTDYLLKSKSFIKNKVKIKIDDKIYCFFVEASIIKGEEDKRVIVFSDITSEEQYLTLSLTDELTQIGNRRYFNNKLDSEISRANRYESSLSLIFFDIDFFKKINDEHGHDVGDKVLSIYSKGIKECLRSEDIFCRIGGEEFAIILPLMDKKSAKHLAQKLRIFVQDYKEIVPLTMSFGVVEYVPKESSDMFYKRADNALYEAKNSGRNVVVAG